MHLIELSARRVVTAGMLRRSAMLGSLMFSSFGCHAEPIEAPTAAPTGLTDPLACARETPEYEAADARIRAFFRRVHARRKGPGESVEALNEALDELRASRCFERSLEQGDIGAQSNDAMLDWWYRGGGKWLESYLGVAPPGGMIFLPPSPRQTLHLEGHEDSPIAEVLCPRDAVLGVGPRGEPIADRQGCGYQTQSWLRAAVRGHLYWALWSGDWRGWGEGNANPAAERCGEWVAKQDLVPSYRRWRACVEAERGRMTMLPAGVFEAPKRGWLLLEYNVGYCHGRFAYHLESGAAQKFEVCNDRIESEQQGIVPIDRIREATLMAILSDYQREGSPSGEVAKVPAGLPIIWPSSARAEYWAVRRPSARNAHDRIVAFQWWDGEVIVEGSVTGIYNDGTGGQVYVRDLLVELAEIQVFGPAPFTLPAATWPMLGDDGHDEQR